MCAQAICIEEMLSVPVPEGAIFDSKMRRRHPVHFDIALRAEVEQLSIEMHRLEPLRRQPRPVPFAGVSQLFTDRGMLPGTAARFRGGIPLSRAAEERRACEAIAKYALRDQRWFLSLPRRRECVRKPEWTKSRFGSRSTH